MATTPDLSASHNLIRPFPFCERSFTLVFPHSSAALWAHQINDRPNDVCRGFRWQDVKGHSRSPARDLKNNATGRFGRKSRKCTARVFALSGDPNWLIAESISASLIACRLAEQQLCKRVAKGEPRITAAYEVLRDSGDVEDIGNAAIARAYFHSQLGWLLRRRPTMLAAQGESRLPLERSGKM
jgi:hypothetical protein